MSLLVRGQICQEIHVSHIHTSWEAGRVLLLAGGLIFKAISRS
jgi:hypothetical protein